MPRPQNVARARHRKTRQTKLYALGYTTLVRIVRIVREADNNATQRHATEVPVHEVKESAMKMLKQAASESLIYLAVSILVLVSLHYVDLLSR